MPQPGDGHPDLDPDKQAAIDLYRWLKAMRSGNSAEARRRQSKLNGFGLLIAWRACSISPNICISQMANGPGAATPGPVFNRSRPPRPRGCLRLRVFYMLLTTCHKRTDWRPTGPGTMAGNGRKWQEMAGIQGKMGGRGSSVASKHDELVRLVGSGHTVAGAAKQLGMPERTAYRHAAEPAFKNRVREIRDETIRRASRALANLSMAACNALATLLESKDDRVKLRAAVAILEALVPITNQADVVERIEALEARAREHDGPKRGGRR